MDFMNDDLMEALSSGKYVCSKCGETMEFEDEWEDILVCPACGHSIDLDRYGFEDDEDYEKLYPTREEVLGYDEEEDLDGDGETYDEVYNELSDD